MRRQFPTAGERDLLQAGKPFHQLPLTVGNPPAALAHQRSGSPPSGLAYRMRVS